MWPSTQPVLSPASTQAACEILADQSLVPSRIVSYRESSPNHPTVSSKWTLLNSREKILFYLDKDPKEIDTDCLERSCLLQYLAENSFASFIATLRDDQSICICVVWGHPPCNAPSARWPLYLQRNCKHSRNNHNLSILPFNTYQCTDQVDFFKTIDTYLTWVHGTEYWLLSTEYCILGLDTEYWVLSTGHWVVGIFAVKSKVSLLKDRVPLITLWVFKHSKIHPFTIFTIVKVTFGLETLFEKITSWGWAVLSFNMLKLATS